MVNKFVELGKTGIKITPVGQGVMQFSEGRGIIGNLFSGISREESNNIVKEALDGGINWFDTAEIYGRGRSEKGLSEALLKAGRKNGDVIIASKWWPVFRTAESINKTFPEREANLSPFNIDLHQVHQPFSFSTVKAEMKAMARLVEDNKIKSIGVSNYSAKAMENAFYALADRKLVLASNQVHFSLVNRKIETNGIMEGAKRLGITIISWSPLEQGLLTGKFHKDPDLLKNRPRLRRILLNRIIDKSRVLIECLEDIAGNHNVTISQVALNWMINYFGNTVVVIPGATKAKHARESAGAMNFTLSDEEMQRIDKLSSQFK